MSDTFHPSITDDEILRWINVMTQLPNHQFQILTKRTKRMQEFVNRYQLFHDHMQGKYSDNIWWGTSVENQETAKHRLFFMRYFDAKIKFVSFEPLLGPIEKPDLRGINWIIIGGESGDNPRPMKAEWAQNLIDYTRANYPDCKIFFKQVGGKGRDGAGGCKINGQEIKEFPNFQAATC